MLIRSNTPFTNNELALLEQISLTLSSIFEILYVIVTENQIEHIFNVSDNLENNQIKIEYAFDNTPSTALNFLYQIDSLSQEKFRKISFVRKALENSDNPVKAFAKNINKWVPCQAGAILLKNITQDYLLKLPEENLINIGGLIQQCFLRNETIYIKQNVSENAEFNARIDNLGIMDPIENILCIPISDNINEVSAVICLVNSPNGFLIDDIILAQFFSLIARELLHYKCSGNDRNQTILKENRKNKIFQQ